MSKASSYAVRFNRVFDYIDEHIDEVLSLEELSHVADFSKYHFHRQFSEYTGMSVCRYVQLIRFKRASYRLAFNRADRIIDIALDTGFENPESFSRAFKNTFGQTPSEFRKNPAWKQWNQRYKFPTRERKQNMDVKIIGSQQTKIVVLEHRGTPELLNDCVFSRRLPLIPVMIATLP